MRDFHEAMRQSLTMRDFREAMRQNPDYERFLRGNAEKPDGGRFPELSARNTIRKMISFPQKFQTRTKHQRGFERGVLDLIVKKGDLYFADLSPVVGSEQGGVRPVLVVQLSLIHI